MHLLFLAAIAFQHALAAPHSIPLKVSALNRTLFFGSAVNMKHVTADPNYAKFAAQEFSILTPENDFKFNTLHPERNTYRFEVADSLIDFAKKNHQLVRGHTLVWHNPEALPHWLTHRKHSPAKLRKILRSHIETTMKHFKRVGPATVVAWDVLNEAFDDSGQFRTDSIWAPIAKSSFEFFKFS